MFRILQISDILSEFFFNITAAKIFQIFRFEQIYYILRSCHNYWPYIENTYKYE